MNLHRQCQRLGLSGLILAAALPGAWAQDIAAFEQRLKAELAEQGVVANWSAARQNGAQITLEGVTFGSAAPDGGTPATVGTVVMDDVSEQNGGYRVGRVTFPTYSNVEEDLAVDASGITMTGLRIPAENTTDPIAGLLLYETAEVANVSIKRGGAEVFTLSDVSIELSPLDNSAPLRFSGAADQFTINFDQVPDAQTKAVLTALGYTQMTGEFETAGVWNPADGNLALEQYELTVENAGTLGMTFDLGGYTSQFAQSLRELQARMAAQPAGTEDPAQNLAMLGLMQQLLFKGASVRFEDDSLTQKILDYVAKQQGVSANDIKNQAKAVLPFLTTQLGNPELSTQITGAVNAFLDNPQSLEIAAKPGTPVPFAQLAATASANPLELTRSLGLTVTANEGGAQGGEAPPAQPAQ